MDTPLLALTRRRSGPPPAGPSADVAAADNMRQLIQLRWLALTGQILTVLAVRWQLGIALPTGPMLGTAGLLAAGNLFAMAWARKRRVTAGGILLSLLGDMVALTVQLHLSGGATNPFILLYLLQVVLGAILLRAPSVWLLLGATSLCYGFLTLNYRPLVFPAALHDKVGALQLLGNWVAFTLAAVLLVLFSMRISRNLHAREAYLAAVRQHAAEEDGIVRTGLFASGAAHALGTPLASLAVILSDWKRMPRLAADPELAAEIAEMEGEVERCKTIVADLLHAAGQPRGEAMERVPACAFLEAAAAAWQPTHPGVPFRLRCELPREAFIVADPSLRQALWNLLDNAAEVSPGSVELRAWRRDDMMVIAVRDKGPGFPPERLLSVGRLQKSRKGAGHGLGLFLAANVARQLGGGLEMDNLPEGGAEVRLTLSLAGPVGEAHGRGTLPGRGGG